MKNLFVYYLLVFLPVPYMIWAAINDGILFVILLIFYYIYRKIIDAKRLVDKKIIESKEIWKVILIPFYSTFFIKQLFFEN